MRKHTRAIYGFLDLLGDLGGVTEVIMITFGILFYPISEHSFIMTATKKLFMARTNEPDLFLQPKEIEVDKHFVKVKKKSRRVSKELAKHKEIRVRMADNVLLFLQNRLGCLFPSRLWSKSDKLAKLFEEGADRLDTNLNLVKIIKNLRNMRCLMKYSLLTPEIEFMIKNAEHNLINVDDSSDNDQEELNTQRSKEITETDESDMETGRPMNGGITPQAI
jgi:hypothetical protein